MWIKLSRACRLCAVALIVAACTTQETAPPAAAPARSVIANVTVVDARSGSLREHMSVVVENGKIFRIAAASSVPRDSGALWIDATGKFLVPGYNDMHTHLMDVVGTQLYWPQVIANGITGFRQMSGSASTIARARRLNADSAAGRVDAPEVLQVPGDFVLPFMSPAAMDEIIQRQKAEGADFIKTPAQTPAMYEAMMTAARKYGLPVAGHISPFLSQADASNAGWRSIEHLGAGLGAPLDCSTRREAIRADIAKAPRSLPSLPGRYGVVHPLLMAPPIPLQYQQVTDSFDEAICTQLARTFVKNETWNVPTLIRLHTVLFSTDAAYRNDPNLRFVEPGRLVSWRKAAEQYAATVPEKDAAVMRAYYAYQIKALQLLHREGAKVLTGTDMGIWCIPGFSLHQEFKLLARAGYTPQEILRMTTWDAAEFLHRTADMGSVDEGKNANLVLLEANPLTDVDNMAKIWGVFLKGRYQSKDTLQKMLDDAAAGFAQQSVAAYRETHDHAD